jgi:hypothetical protein
MALSRPPRQRGEERVKLIVDPVGQIGAVRRDALPDLKPVILRFRRNLVERFHLPLPVTQPRGFALLHIRSGLLIGVEFAAFELLERALNLRGNGVPLLVQPAIVSILVAAFLHRLGHKRLLFRTECNRHAFSRDYPRADESICVPTARLLPRPHGW